MFLCDGSDRIGGFWTQMVAISPTRLRMKLLGSNHKDDPTRKTLQASRLDDDDHPNNSLLPQELDEGACVARTPWHSIPSSWHRPATATTAPHVAR